ncbi:MAG: TetR/AcrR family transcriptional regulator [Lysobacteraceae bacterium]|nr:MAG: TetR/AcrR family transcriptional regulator [Xanthomonadaceae bacterium]
MKTANLIADADGKPGIRQPQQVRSRASFERMLEAAEALLIERGSDEFALTDVSRIGRVSIGSIYNRFNSKDELIHVVHGRVMERLETEQAKIVMRARSRSNSLDGLVRACIDELAEFLRKNAPIMRPLMLRAAFDRDVQDRGRDSHDLMVESLTTELMSHETQIGHPDPTRAIHSIIRIAYAAFARELGFGMAEAPQGGAPWEELKEDVGSMAAAFLLTAR